ncbi:hypothetical protein QE152_g36744 [Popillia japonica]|uniref:Uncharacterized protein n=1 Tax=Popillia japonica TaxID=7064 RepID=A0AAW1ICH7_POPJA
MFTLQSKSTSLSQPKTSVRKEIEPEVTVSAFSADKGQILLPTVSAQAFDSKGNAHTQDRQSIEQVLGNRSIHFIEHTYRNPDGRFVVSIPFKTPVDALGDSFVPAQRRFLSLEKRLQATPELASRYCTFMKDYEELGHMTISSHSPLETCYYLPHHGFLKEESLTTKLRVVFNGSTPTTSGYSLNHLQMVGPTIQPNLFNILICFRQHPSVCYCG